MKAGLVSRGGGLVPEQCPAASRSPLPWLPPGPGAVAVLNSPGLRPALPWGPGKALPLCCLNGSVSSLGAVAMLVGAAAPRRCLFLPSGLGWAWLWLNPVLLPRSAGEILPGLLTSGKAELRLDPTECFLWFYTLKKAYFYYWTGMVSVVKKLSDYLNSLIRT